MNLRDSKPQTHNENLRATAEHNNPRGTPRFHRQRHLPILHRLEDAYFYYRPFVDYYYYRFKKTFWTTVFALMFLGFVYILCFVDESERFSDDTARIGAFTCALFALVSYLMSQPRAKQEAKPEKQCTVMKNNRPYAEDRRLLNQLLRNDLRQAMV